MARTRLPDEVTIDALTADCRCPWHGPQSGAEYEPGRAPCGCLWYLDNTGRLRARQNDETLSLAEADLQQDSRAGVENEGLNWHVGAQKRDLNRHSHEKCQSCGRLTI